MARNRGCCYDKGNAGHVLILGGIPAIRKPLDSKSVGAPCAQEHLPICPTTDLWAQRVELGTRIIHLITWYPNYNNINSPNITTPTTLPTPTTININTVAAPSTIILVGGTLIKCVDECGSCFEIHNFQTHGPHSLTHKHKHTNTNTTTQTRPYAQTQTQTQTQTQRLTQTHTTNIDNGSAN
jgi:hypothetical protein